MAIPALTPEGLLPAGLHEASMGDVAARFGGTAWIAESGRQRLSLQRRRLTEGLCSYVDELRRDRVAAAVIINGSYVTSKPEPNDVDVFVVYGSDYDPDRPVSPVERRLLDNSYTMRDYGVNVFDGPEDSLRYRLVIDRWEQARGMPGRTKGMVRITL